MKKLLLSGLLSFSTFAGIARDKVDQNFGRQSLHFLENNGQVKDEKGRTKNDLDFSMKGNGVSIFIGNGKIAYQWARTKGKSGKEDILKMEISLKGANKNAVITKSEKQSFNTRFCKDNTTITAYSYDRITYKDIYPGIDWVLYIKDGLLEYDFVVHEDADPSVIQMVYSGDVKLKSDKDGGITASTRLGTVKQQKPFSYTEEGKEIASSFNLKKNTLSFKVSKHAGTLVIDPLLTWSTYYGGGSNDEYWSVKADAFGFVYAGGATQSTTGISTNSTTHQADWDGFISKFDVAGNLIWSTYYGTISFDIINEIAVDGGNALYATGNSGISGNSQAFVAKFDTAGNFLTDLVLGGNGGEYGQGVSVDGAGNVYICGSTAGWNENTVGCYQPVYGGGNKDGYIAKLNSQLSVQWCTYYGGSGDDEVSSIAAEPLNKVNFAGYTSSTGSIATTGTSQTVYGGGNSDAFVGQFNANTQALNWASYLGGNLADEAMGVSFDGAGSVYIGGQTFSTSGIATTGSHQDVNGGARDGFIAKYNSTGIIQWSTYYGGLADDGVLDIHLTAHDVIACGTSLSNNLLVPDAFQTTYGGGMDGMLVKINKNTGVLDWASYFGGNNYDMPFGVSADMNGNIFIAGTTASTNNVSFNTSVQPVHAGGFEDAFITRIGDCDLLTQPTAITGDDTICAGSTQTYSIPAIPFASLYIWTKPNGWTGNSFTETITLTANSTGGPVTVYAYNGCDTTTVITLNIVVNPLPTPTITQAGNTLSTATFTTYQWYLNGSPISGATNQSYTATQGGNYHVVVTDTNGCTGQATAIPVSVGELTLANNLHIYPNPNKGIFSVAGTFPSGDGNISMQVLDITGRIVLDESFIITRNTIDKNVHLAESIPAGTYIIRIKSDKGSTSLQLRKD